MVFLLLFVHSLTSAFEEEPDRLQKGATISQEDSNERKEGGIERQVGDTEVKIPRLVCNISPSSFCPARLNESHLSPTPPLSPVLVTNEFKEEREKTNSNHEENKKEEDVVQLNDDDVENINTTLFSGPSSTINGGQKVGERIRFCNTPDEEEEEEEEEAGNQTNSNNNTSHPRYRRYTLHGKKWEKTELKWTLRKPSLHSHVIDSGTIRQQITAAMQVWEKASTLRFIEVHKESTDVDIYVDFEVGPHGDHYDFDGKGMALAHAFYPGRGIGGDIHFDDGDTFVSHHLREQGKSSLLITAAHELGHSLGMYSNGSFILLFVIVLLLSFPITSLKLKVRSGTFYILHYESYCNVLFHSNILL